MKLNRKLIKKKLITPKINFKLCTILVLYNILCPFCKENFIEIDAFIIPITTITLFSQSVFIQNIDPKFL